ncbi:hypothetical protein WH47_06742 [Habropoda laboriosa]|uniref:Uncharacterized protein n=1 Tax=Habropoda laboriosa TaxID=597456 RepID=A0A0L7RI88_9HYME|nr:hypothetical protein WH47_06742 [Habropoda laboriosa]
MFCDVDGALLAALNGATSKLCCLRLSTVLASFPPLLPPIFSPNSRSQRNAIREAEGCQCWFDRDRAR